MVTLSREAMARAKRARRLIVQATRARIRVRAAPPSPADGACHPLPPSFLPSFLPSF